MLSTHHQTIAANTESAGLAGPHLDDPVAPRAGRYTRRAVVAIVAAAALAAGFASVISDASARSKDHCVLLDGTDPSVCDPA
jgi:hypothetical protein